MSKEISSEVLKEFSNKSQCNMGNWSEQDETRINNQINIELNAFHFYNSLYGYFSSDSVGFTGIAKYFKKSADEELEHSRKFMEYQNIRGGSVEVRNIEKPNVSFDFNCSKSILYQAINYALEAEQKVYKSILNISKNTEDTALEDFLDDFLKEQLEAQYDLGLKLKQLEIIGNDGYGLLQFDKDLN